MPLLRPCLVAADRRCLMSKQGPGRCYVQSCRPCAAAHLSSGTTGRCTSLLAQTGINLLAQPAQPGLPAFLSSSSLTATCMGGIGLFTSCRSQPHAQTRMCSATKQPSSPSGSACQALLVDRHLELRAADLLQDCSTARCNWGSMVPAFPSKICGQSFGITNQLTLRLGRATVYCSCHASAPAIFEHQACPAVLQLRAG